MLKKAELIEKCVNKYGCTKKYATEAVETVTALLWDAIIEDGGFDLFGFMKVEKKFVPARKGRNPMNGEEIDVAAKYAPRATFSKALKREMNV